MNVSDLLTDLSKRGVVLWSEDNHLRYRAPKGSITAAELKLLSEYKADILTFLSHQNPAVSLPPSELLPDPEQRYDAFPLTEIQRAYWLGRSAAFELGNVGNHCYIEFEAVDLDLARFIQCLQRLIERHDMLRAVTLPDGRQCVLAQVPLLQVPVIDLCLLCRGEQACSQALIREALDHRLIQIEDWPAFAIWVSRLDERRVCLHFSIEFLFIDAWSMSILIREFTQLYQDPTALLPTLHLSFRDYVLAEALRPTDKQYRRSQVYWMQRLPDLPSAPELPLATAPELLSRHRFVHRRASLPDKIWQRLKARGAQAGLTPSGLLLAAFAEVLSTWSKSPRFSINLSLFNRSPLHPQVNELVGDFTSLTVLAVDTSQLAPFEQRARHLQEQLWSDFDHRYFSGVSVLRELARLHNTMTTAIMPVVFTSMLAHETVLQYDVSSIYCLTQTPQVWLDHQVYEAQGELMLYWQSVDELFPAGLLDTMFTSYCHFLETLATEERTWQMVAPELLSSSELAQRALANSTTAPLSDELLHTLFLQQAARTPDYPAVIAPDRSLTYTQLAARSLLLGHRLRQLDARPNQLVAVVMEKGWEQIVAVLGILQAGAAYLPLDPHLPQERLTYLLHHGEVQIVLTQKKVAQLLSWLSAPALLLVDELPDQQVGLKPLESVQKSDDLAYVIYTSGSTGLPKGVMIDHRGAVNTILDLNQRFAVGPGDRVLALSALNFDLSVYDIFGLLAAGGAIVMPPEDSSRNPAIWLDLLSRERVSIWNTVPALLQLLLEYAEAHMAVLEQTDLRLALLSGDWIPLSLPPRLKDFVPGIEVISLGGATEASIWSIYHPIQEIEPGWKSILYGKPLLNQRFHVLNERGMPCPVWVPGQLYIAGVGLARGYWHDEAKTASSFVLHTQSGERLYRTGDLGRYLPDGSIEFLGREDFQVKVQGHRIELGEIEETLLQHEKVCAAVATTLTEPGGSKYLAAYVVLQEEPLANNLNREQDYNLRMLEAHFGQASLRKEEGRPALKLASEAPGQEASQRYRQRLSYRSFQQKQLGFEQFSAFLGSLRQIELEGLPKYLYPSAGGIYPVQIYLAVKPERIEQVATGVYYYDPHKHHLVLLSAEAQLTRDLHAEINQAIFDESAFSLFLIGQLSLIAPHYGEAARDFCLLEAGYISQLLMDRAPEYQIGICPIGGLNFEPVREMFALESSHVLLHSLLGGQVDATNATGWSFLERSPDARQALSPTASGIDTDTLRQFLREKLPEYMVPTAMMILNELPLTPNGKVDRAHLPAITASSNRHEELYMAPQSELERVIAGVWQDVLATEKVGIYDNFFDSGGNSLLMARAYNKLHSLLGREIPLVDMFFRYPNIHALAEFLTQEHPSQVEVMAENLHERQARLESRKVVTQQQKQARQKHRTQHQKTR